MSAKDQRELSYAACVIWVKNFLIEGHYIFGGFLRSCSSPTSQIMVMCVFLATRIGLLCSGNQYSHKVVKCPRSMSQFPCKFSASDPPHFSVPIETRDFGLQQSDSPDLTWVSRAPCFKIAMICCSLCRVPFIPSSPLQRFLGLRHRWHAKILC